MLNYKEKIKCLIPNMHGICNRMVAEILIGNAPCYKQDEGGDELLNRMGD